MTVVFVELPNTKIELLEPLGADSPIAAFLARNPAGGIHHICYEVDDIIAARDRLKASGARVLTTAQIRRSKARRTLAARGMLEAVTWCFVSKAQAELFGGGSVALVLANPIASDLSDMRPSLLPGLIAAIQRNGRSLARVAIGFVQFAVVWAGWLAYGAAIAGEASLVLSVEDIQGLLLGGHGDDMVPLPRLTSVNGIPVSDLLPEAKIQACVDRAKVGGGVRVALLHHRSPLRAARFAQSA